MKRINEILDEALDANNQIAVLDLQKDIIDLKTRLVDTEDGDEKERIKGEIEALKTRIQSVRDTAQE